MGYVRSKDHSNRCKRKSSRGRGRRISYLPCQSNRAEIHRVGAHFWSCISEERMVFHIFSAAMQQEIVDSNHVEVFLLGAFKSDLWTRQWTFGQ